MKRLLIVLLIISTLIIFTACNTIEGIKKDLHLPLGEKTESSDDNNDKVPDNNDQDNGNTNDNAETKTKADEWRKAYNCITVKEAIDICASTGSTETEKQYYVIVEIVEITDSFYGNMTVKDSTGRITVYGSYGADGEKRYGELGTTAPKVGDVVLFYTNLVNYGNIQPEMHNSRIIDFYTPGDDNSGNTGTGSGDSNSGNTGTGSGDSNSGNTGTGSGDSNSGNTGSGSTSTTHTYNDFTSAEKSTMMNIIGEVLPFAPNDEYYVESYEDAVEFYTFDLTEADLSAYRLKLSSYIYTGSEVDEDYSDVIWHIYTKGDLVVELSLYYNEDEDYGTYSVLHVYAYLDTNTDSGNTGTGNTGSGSAGSGTDTNLPEGVDGVYGVDFTDATNVKDVTDQGYYLGGCPTTGSPAVLVIPIQFSDKLAMSSHDLDKLDDAFTKIDPNDGFYSVYEYYFISSYEQLTLDITVLDNWFKPKYNSSYYENSKDSEGYANGDMLIMDEALAYLATIMDLSKFDSDNNDMIDAVILINTLDVAEDDFHWAYRYWNYHTDSQGDYYEYDGVSANDYIWASYNFLFESYDSDDNVIYTDTSVMNTYTFIHEFAHVLGVDDYYNYNGDDHPLDGCDVMDIMFGDHNPYSKFNLGWIKTSRLVVTDTSISLTLEDFSKSGDTIIIANDWDEDLGAYQEYYVLMYYKGTGLNDIDAGYGYFSRDGVVVYHVNATLCTETIDGETYYDVANNNNSPADDGSGSEDNLIEFVKSSADTFTYIEGDTLPAVTDDDGDTLAYTFTVDSITDSYATITFTAN